VLAALEARGFDVSWRSEKSKGGVIVSGPDEKLGLSR
jgi:hypothetical protein